MRKKLKNSNIGIRLIYEIIDNLQGGINENIIHIIDHASC